MKKKDLLMLMATAMLTPAELASCTSELESTQALETQAVTRSVTFNISMPAGDPVHYSRALQDGNEYNFNTLKMLVYDAKDETLLEVKDITAESGPTPNGDDYQYTYTEPMADGTLARRFVFLANDAATDANLVATTKTYEDLPAAQAAVAVAAEAQSTTFASGYLPMSGEAKTNGSLIINMSQDANVAVDVEMTRAVARIDVANNVPNLEITSLKLINANPNGFLMQSGAVGSIAVPTGMTKVNGVEPFNPISGLVAYDNTDPSNPVENDNVAEDGKFLPYVQTPFKPATLKKAFYVYEDVDNAADGVLTLLVEGKLSNTIGVYYQIPFVKGNVDGYTRPAGLGEDDPDPTAAEGIEIDRNHLYTVTIGDGSKVGINTRMMARLNVVDWDANTDVDDTFYSELFTGVTNDVTGVSYNKVTQHFEIPATALADADGVSIDVADTYWDGGDGVNIIEIQVLTDGAWTTAASTGTSTSNWLNATFTTETDVTKADAVNKRITIAADANDTGSDRNGAIRLIYKNKASDASADQKITFTITQKG